jgi:hypothetical protein
MVRVLLAVLALSLLPGCVVRQGFAGGGYYQSPPVTSGYYRGYRPYRQPAYHRGYRPYRPPAYQPGYRPYRPPAYRPGYRPYARPPFSSNPHVYRGSGGYRPQPPGYYRHR